MSAGAALQRTRTADTEHREAIADLKARVDIVAVVGRYTELKRCGKNWSGCCPLHVDKRPSFKVDPTRQSFICFAGCAKGDVVDFIAAVENIGIAGALERLRDIVGDGGTSAPVASPRRAETPAAERNPGWLAAALRLYEKAVPIEPGSVAASYLTARGCALPHPDGHLRWLPDHRHPGGWRGACLVALITAAVTGEPMTVHRTWVQPDGTKAPVNKPRLLWPGLRKTGGVVRLWPDDAVTTGLCVAEGVETALTAAKGFGLAWACIDAGNLASFPVLDGIEALTIAADNDRPDRRGRRAGQASAEECARRWSAADVEVRLWVAPSEGVDLNDYARTAVPC